MTLNAVFTRTIAFRVHESGEPEPGYDAAHQYEIEKARLVGHSMEDVAQDY
jgi:hypothetical protein